MGNLFEKVQTLKSIGFKLTPVQSEFLVPIYYNLEKFIVKKKVHHFQILYTNSMSLELCLWHLKLCPQQQKVCSEKICNFVG